MRNFVSLRYVHDNAPSIWKYMTEHDCILKKFGSIVYEGKMSEGKYLKYLSDEDAPSMTIECYVNPDSTLLLTVEKNDYIDKLKGLSESVSGIMSSPKLYCEAINLIGLIPMVEGNTWEEKIKYVLEDDASMSDDSGNEEDNTGDDGQGMDDAAKTDNGSAALGQQGAKDDEKSKKRSEVQFKIFTAPDKQVTDLKDGEKYLKIEYVYRNKEEGIEIDFLIGRKTNDKNWQLYIGKPGSASYDDDPYKSLKTKELSKAINTAVDEVLNLIDEVKKDKDNWVQFYIHR